MAGPFGGQSRISEFKFRMPPDLTACAHDFAFALTVGVLVGTYSSIFVASPVVIAWYRWRSGDRKASSGGKAAPAKA